MYNKVFKRNILLVFSFMILLALIFSEGIIVISSMAFYGFIYSYFFLETGYLARRLLRYGCLLLTGAFLLLTIFLAYAYYGPSLNFLGYLVKIGLPPLPMESF